MIFTLFYTFVFLQIPNPRGTHTFTVTNGQRIMMKVYSSGGGTPCHLELADFTYTVE